MSLIYVGLYFVFHLFSLLFSCLSAARHSLVKPADGEEWGHGVESLFALQVTNTTLWRHLQWLETDI